jgi:hypothetical protein
MSWHLYAVVELGTMRVMSQHKTIRDATHTARRAYHRCPCDVMALVLDDAEKPVGVQQLSRREMRSIAGWQPEFKSRPEDIVNSRHKYDPPENPRLQENPERHPAPWSPVSHPDIL